MSYTLVTTNGSRMQFYLLTAAEIFQTIYGGEITEDLVDTHVE